MAKQEILISINLRGAGEASDGVNKLRRDYSKLTEEELKLLKVERERVLQNRDIVAGIDQEIIATNAKANATKAARTQAGLNNAILLETGRLASDASYGFTAMANNLSQITSLFGSFIQTNDGVIKSFKQLGKSLMGTGGVLLLIQLFIAALQSERVKEFINSLQGLSKAMKLVKDSFNEANNEYGKQLGFLRTMQTLLNDTNVSQKQKAVILNRVKKEHDELNPKLDEEGKLTEDSTAKMEAYLVVLEKKAKSQALLNTIQEEYVKLQKLEDSTADENIGTLDVLKDKFNQLIKGQSAFTVSTELLTTGEEKRQEAIDESKKTIEELTEKLKELGIFNDEEENEQNKRRPRIFKERYLDYEKQIIASQERVKETETTNQKDLLLIEMDGIAQRANLKQKDFEENQARRLRDFLLSDATLKEKEEAERRYNNSIATSRKSLNDYLIQLDEEYLAKLDDLESTRELEDLAGFGRALQDFNTERLKFQEEYLKSYTDSEIDRVEVAKLIEQDRFNNEMANLNAQRDAKIAIGESTLAIDQEILNAEKANSEAKIALAEQERDAKIAISNQVGNAIVAVAGEGSTVGKAASIAMAIMNTKEAFTAALGKKPYGPWNIAQAAAVFAMGMKQVKDIMATKIPGKEPSTGGGGGTIIEAPDFNIVGASQQSQLAQAVSTAQQQPVKAFVVGKDISTQQELDRNITNTASFG